MKECPRCSLGAPDSQRSCSRCGSILPVVASAPSWLPEQDPQVLFCASCRAELRAGSRFCHDCGASQIAVPSPVTAASPEAPSGPPVPPDLALMDEAVNLATHHVPIHTAIPQAERSTWPGSSHQGFPLASVTVAETVGMQLPLSMLQAAVPVAPPAPLADADQSAQQFEGVSELVRVPDPPVPLAPGAAPALDPASIGSNSQHAPAAPTINISRFGRRSMVIGAAAVLVLMIVGGATAWLLTGVRLTVVTDPPGATVILNGTSYGTSGASGLLQVPRIGRGTQRLRVERAGYLAVEQELSLGWSRFAASTAVRLIPSTVTITIAVPAVGTEVLLDGVRVSAEVLSHDRVRVGNVARGERKLVIRRPGYLPWQENISLGADRDVAVVLQPDFSGEWTGTAVAADSFRLPVRIAIEHRAGSLAVSNVSRNGARSPLSNASATGSRLAFAFGTMMFTAEIAADGRTLSGRVEGALDAAWTAERILEEGSGVTLPPPDGAETAVTRARVLFERREYQQALDTCAEALRLRPDHTGARVLRQQIERTMDVLGVSR